MTLTDLESGYLCVCLEELTLSWLAEYSMPQAEHAGLVGEVGKVRASSRGHCDLDFLALSQGARVGQYVNVYTFFCRGATLGLLLHQLAEAQSLGEASSSGRASQRGRRPGSTRQRESHRTRRR